MPEMANMARRQCTISDNSYRAFFSDFSVSWKGSNPKSPAAMKRKQTTVPASHESVCLIGYGASFTLTRSEGLTQNSSLVHNQVSSLSRHSSNGSTGKVCEFFSSFLPTALFVCVCLIATVESKKFGKERDAYYGAFKILLHNDSCRVGGATARFLQPRTVLLSCTYSPRSVIDLNNFTWSGMPQLTVCSRFPSSGEFILHALPDELRHMNTDITTAAANGKLSEFSLT